MKLIYEHHLDPSIFHLGPLQPRWYALMYIVGFIFAYNIIVRHPKFVGRGFNKEDAMDVMTYGFFGVILGGRLGYVLLYNLPYYLQHPTKIIAVWEGGMAFHGALIGCILAAILYARKKKIPVLTFFDIIALPTPLGLMFGRLGNFINGELWGKPTDGSWGVRFKEYTATGQMHYGPLRHPTQLYEAGLEGLTLFLVLFLATRYGKKLKDGSIGALFLMGYGCARFTVEFWRIPDPQIGYLYGGWLTQGQVLSTPMILGGLIMLLLVNFWPRKAVPEESQTAVVSDSETIPASVANAVEAEAEVESEAESESQASESSSENPKA